MKPYRQGDILLIPTTTIPRNATPVPRENGRIVLAHGEVTGHCHAINDPTTIFLQVDLDEMADRFLKIEQEIQVVHDEHDPITLPPGNYIVRHKREYAPEAPRFVAD